METVIVSFNRFELEIPKECIEHICTPGSNDAAVEEWRDKVAYPALDKIKVELDEWIDDLEPDKPTEFYHQYLLWIAAWNYFDAQRSDEEDD